MRRLLLAAAAVLAAVLLQATILSNLPLPGGSPPDLVLLVVVTLALASSPTEGAVIGFAAGLAADIAPPAVHLVGQSALVFCLVGYGCGRMRAPLERSALLPLAGIALAVAAGESLYALAGVTFGDPDITWQTIREVLPVSVIYDIVLSPFVLYAVARFAKFGEWAAATSPPGLLTGPELSPAGMGLAIGNGAVRDTGSGRGPRLKAAGARGGEGWIGGGLRDSSQRPGGWVPRQVRLRLRGGVAGSASASQFSLPSRAGPMPAAPLRLGSSRRRDKAIGAAPGGPGGVAARATFGDGAGAARLRAGAFSGGQSAVSQGGGRRPLRTVRLKLGSRRRGDGLVGGGALGSGLRGGRVRRRRMPGKGAFSGGTGRPGTPAALSGRRELGVASPLRSGRGYGARPRFRGTGRGLFGRWRSRAGRKSSVWRTRG